MFTKPSQICDYANVFGPCTLIVHWLPNCVAAKLRGFRKIWPQIGIIYQIVTTKCFIFLPTGALIEMVKVNIGASTYGCRVLTLTSLLSVGLMF
jgi:hypothetical protein